MGKRKKHGDRIFGGALIFVCILSVCMAVCFGIMAYRDLYARQKAKDDYRELAVRYAPPVQELQTTVLPEETVSFYPVRDIDHAALKQQNNDYIGWLYFPFIGKEKDHTFTIDYPVVYERKANQYLRADFQNEYSTGGSVFMDRSSNPSFFGYSDILYGHHMRDGSMFGQLEQIHEMDDLSYLKENPQFLYVYTKSACHKYVLAGYEQTNTSNSFGYSVAYDNKAYDLIRDHIMSLDTYLDSGQFTWTGRPEILNLSTCDGDRAGGSSRFLVHFVKVAAYAYE